MARKKQRVEYPYEVICLGSIDWNDLWQRPQQLMSLFAASGHPVLYVNSTPAPFNVEDAGRERAGMIGADRAWDKLKSALAGEGLDRFLLRVGPNLRVLDPVRQVKMELPDLSTGIYDLTISFLREVLARLGWRNHVTVIYWLGWWNCIGKLGSRATVFDCVDDLAQFFPPEYQEAAERTEQIILRESDLVITTSERLRLEKAPFNPHVHLVANGVDPAQFVPGALAPADMRSLKPPVIGFAGAVASWVDLDMIRQVALARPDWSIAVVGPLLVPLPQGHFPGNVAWLGRKPHEELPSYIGAFDVATIPFKGGRLSGAADPIKLYEYLACGKPVIISGIPDLGVRTPLWYSAEGVEGFIEAAERAIREDGEDACGKRRAFAERNSWQARWEAMDGLIGEALRSSGQAGEAGKADKEKESGAAGETGEAGEAGETELAGGTEKFGEAGDPGEVPTKKESGEVAEVPEFAEAVEVAEVVEFAEIAGAGAACNVEEAGGPVTSGGEAEAGGHSRVSGDQGMAGEEINEVASRLGDILLSREILAQEERWSAMSPADQEIEKAAAGLLDGRAGDALESLTSLAGHEDTEKEPGFHYNLGLALLACGRTREAAGALEKAAGMIEENCRSHSAGGPGFRVSFGGGWGLARVLVALGDARVILGELQDAEVFYRRALAWNPDDKAAMVSIRLVSEEAAGCASEADRRLFNPFSLEIWRARKVETALRLGLSLQVACLVGGTGLTGGARVLFEHVNRLQEKGHSVRVLSHFGSPRWFPLKGEFFQVPLSTGLAEFCGLCDVLVASFWTQLHELALVPGAVPVYLAQGDRYLFENEAGLRTRGYSHRVQHVADRVHEAPVSIHVISRALEEIIGGRYGRAAVNLGSAIDHDHFYPRPKVRRSRPRVLLVARAEFPFKGVQEAFQALETAAASGEQFEVVWVTPSRPDRLPALPFPLRVAVNPDPGELGGLYRSADILVSASYYESFCLPVAEAMACGTAVITTATPGVSEYVRDGVNGLVVPVRDVPAMSEALRRLLSNGALRNRLAQAAPGSVAAYRWDRVVDRLERALWEEVMGPRPWCWTQRPGAYREDPRVSADAGASLALSAMPPVRTGMSPAGIRMPAAGAGTSGTDGGRPLAATGVPRTKSDPARPALSLCMIVRDEEDNLPRCLDSVMGVVDEIIVVDTGSADRTVETAERYGAKVYRIPWHGDFSSARNASLSKASGDWILFLDADEELVGEDHFRLRDLLYDEGLEGHYLNEINFIGETPGAEAVINATFRLFRNRLEYRFRGTLHEQIVPSVQQNGGRIGFSTVRINHYGYLNRPTREKAKIQRNLEILKAQEKRQPRDSFLHFNLGVEYTRLGEAEVALRHYQQSFKYLGSLDMAYASLLVRNIALCLRSLGRYQEALSVLADGVKAYPAYTDLYYLRALVFQNLNSYTEAEKTFRECLSLGEAPLNYVTQRGVGTFRAWHGLGECCEALGDAPYACRAYTQALRAEPNWTWALIRLTRLLLAGSRVEEVLAFLERLVPGPNPAFFTELALVLAGEGYAEEALDCTERARRDCSAAGRWAEGASGSRLRLVRGHVYTLMGRYAEGSAEFTSVPSSSPGFAEALVGKGLCEMLSGRRDLARRSLLMAEEEGNGPEAEAYLVLVEILERGDFQVASASNGEGQIGGEDLSGSKESLNGARQGVTKGKVGGSQIRETAEPGIREAVWGVLERLLILKEFDVFGCALRLLTVFGVPDEERNLRLGKIYGRHGYRESAAEELLKALESGSYDGEACALLAEIAAERGFHEEAADFWRRALELQPDHAPYYASLAACLTEAERRIEALEVLKEGIRRAPHADLLVGAHEALEAGIGGKG